MTAAPGEIVREVRIAARPEEVFPYFTDARLMVVWKAAHAELGDRRPLADGAGGSRLMDTERNKASLTRPLGVAGRLNRQVW